VADKGKGQPKLTFSFAWRQSMRKGPFLPKQFTATQWSTQDDKAEFGNTLLHFIDSGFKLTLFTKKLYSRLSNTFGHIAHYNQGASGRSGSSKPPIRFVSSNICFAGPAMAIQGLPSVTSSAHSGKKCAPATTFQLSSDCGRHSSSERGGSARKGRSEVPPSPCFQ